MASADMMKILYAKKISPLDFKWDSLFAPSLLSLISMEDIYRLNQIVMSNKLSSKPQEKYKLIDDIVTARGFKKIASGTNRITYKYLDNQTIVIKIALDRVGIKDNPAEYINQFKLKPFVTKVFEVSPCGTVGLFERVEPITTREEFLHISDDVFDLLVEKIIGKYVVQDVGSSFFQNYGVRLGFGPVLLDFPYVYELDGSKMYCNRKDPVTHQYCLGEIDYDIGLNNLICTKCGKLYLAKQLEKQVNDKNIIVQRKGVNQAMEIILTRGDEIVETIRTNEESKTILPKEKLLDIKVKNIERYDKNQKPYNDNNSRKKDRYKKNRNEYEKKHNKVLQAQAIPTEDEVTIDIGLEKQATTSMGDIIKNCIQETIEESQSPTVVKEQEDEVPVIDQSEVKEVETDTRCNQNTSVRDYVPDTIPPRADDDQGVQEEEVAESEVEEVDEDMEEESEDEIKNEDTSWDNPKPVSELIIVNDSEDIVNEY